MPNEIRPPLLATSTGEPYQPVRLRWTVPGKSFCLKRLAALRCVGLDALTDRLCVWRAEEAQHLEFEGIIPLKLKNAPLPIGERLVILGVIRFPQAATMTLEVRSAARAVELAKLLQPVLAEKAKLTRVRIVNRLFDAPEGEAGLDALDKELDRNVTVIRWEERERALKDAMAGAPSPQEREAAFAHWHRTQRTLDVPAVEDFPCHPEDETPDFTTLSTTLTLRVVRAFRRWSGEPVTLAQLIEESVAAAERPR